MPAFGTWERQRTARKCRVFERYGALALGGLPAPRTHDGTFCENLGVLKPMGSAPSASEHAQPRLLAEGDTLVTKLKLDLHEIYNKSSDIDAALARVIDEAVRVKASEIEIIPGKGSGALKKRVLRYLEDPEVKVRYHRIEKDSKNFGRIFVHFRWR